MCPKTKKAFATGLAVDHEDKAMLPDRLVFSRCLQCGSSHSWRPRDASFPDELGAWEV